MEKQDLYFNPSFETSTRSRHVFGVRPLFQRSVEIFLAIMLASTFFLLAASTLGATLSIQPRGVPANVTGVKTIQSPSGATVRYKEPGICETMLVPHQFRSQKEFAD